MFSVIVPIINKYFHLEIIIGTKLPQSTSLWIEREDCSMVHSCANDERACENLGRIMHLLVLVHLGGSWSQC